MEQNVEVVFPLISSIDEKENQSRDETKIEVLKENKEEIVPVGKDTGIPVVEAQKTKGPSGRTWPLLTTEKETHD